MFRPSRLHCQNAAYPDKENPMAGPATALNPNQSSAPAAPDLAALKTKQQAAWSSGNYAIVGATLQIVGEELCEALDLKSGSKVLDVAAGNGIKSRRRTALVRRYVHRLRAGAARARPRPRRGGRDGDRIPRSGRGEPAVRGQQF
jgi:hypothetical protein